MPPTPSARGRAGCRPPQEHVVGCERYTLVPASLRAQRGSQEKSIWGTIEPLIKGVRMGKITFRCVETEHLSPCPSCMLATGMPSTTSVPRTHQITSHSLPLPILVSLMSFLPPKRTGKLAWGAVAHQTLVGAVAWGGWQELSPCKSIRTEPESFRLWQCLREYQGITAMETSQ